MADPTEFLRLALEPTRLAVLGHAAAGPVEAGALAAALGIPKRDVLTAINRLQEARLLDDHGELDAGRLREIGAALPRMESASENIMDGSWSVEELRILENAFEGDRLIQLPAQREKRLVVLERIAQEFEPGLRYPERQVNLMIQLLHHDYAAIRRYLVDEDFLTRADGAYWRSGGRYES